jgi:Xaa-Pro dipeptidase
MLKTTPLPELHERLDRLQLKMRETEVDSAIIVQNADLFYFTGTVQQGFLFVPVQGDAIFFVRKILDRVRKESALEKIVHARSPKEIPGALSDFGYPLPQILGMELDVLPYNHCARFEKAFAGCRIMDISPLIRSVRAVKSDYELQIMNDVARLSDSMVLTAKRALREGMSELELAAIVESTARAQGHQGVVRSRGFNQENYWGQLISGPDAAMASFANSPTGGRGATLAFPKSSGYRTIKRNEPVMFDLVAAKDGYLIDQTRILSIGPLPVKLERTYKIALEIHFELEQMIAPGVLTGELFKRALDLSASNGLDSHFMGYGPEKELFCGHGVGIELDELPVISFNSREMLVPGMVIAMEPKFIFPDIGVIGVEDTFIVTDSGHKKLTAAPYEIEMKECS